MKKNKRFFRKEKKQISFSAFFNMCPGKNEITNKHCFKLKTEAEKITF